MNLAELTPVEHRNALYFKRDDLFTVAGVNGGKARACLAIGQTAVNGLITAGSRVSPQLNIVAHVARHLGLPCRCHTSFGSDTLEVQRAREAGAEIIKHRPGWNSVIIKRARDDARELGWTEIPFGMECQQAVDLTCAQVANIPNDIERIVAPVGSGITLSGILHGLKKYNIVIPVVGIIVGAQPDKRLDHFAPLNWRSITTLVTSHYDYHEHAEITTVEGITLDSIYEAKTVPFLRSGDLLWIVGIR